MCTRTPTPVRESLTAQIERLVQAFFNVAPTADTSFVSVIMHSGFAASRSCQNPPAQTLHTPFCNSCQSLFHIALTPQPTPTAGPQPKSQKEKVFPGKVTDQTETEQIPQRIYLCTELSAGSNPSL